ncbi:alpha/beta hydrolase [Ktedonosporobacter rubrisoli]|uniref:Alpha/beta hydrolase n=1 Tax=Ktedonosporobacter rubrisoli TaxID=2509675 RepID=A0A4P6K053_KTERU|nr:alpha/beta hydrolase [Ktedonosporobacter rubrisoli]QBD81558.1 alpha/beta hydrolase [Ktedonosporobacter rubrisoli]
MLNDELVKTGFVEVPGARLYYELAGEGEPLVFLHGGCLDGRMWEEQFLFFARHYQVIRYDARCSGRSESLPSAEPYVHYQDLYRLLQALHISRASLVGLSGGARISIDMAIAHPEMVRKLVAVSPGISGSEFVDEWTNQRFVEFGEASSRGDLAQTVEVFMRMWVYGPYRDAEQVDPELRERTRAMTTRAIAQGAHMLDIHELEPPAIGRLREIQVPTLIILGDKDTSDIHRLGEQLHKQVAGSELTMFADVAHALNMEKPDEFNQLVARFLRG